MRIVVSLGGNALLGRGEPLDAAVLRANVHVAAARLASIAGEHELILTHGNGPQIGLLALQADSYRAVEPYPLDVLGAESEGMIGYMLEQAIVELAPGLPVATLLTQTVVDELDPAFDAPSKPIGPLYDEEAARRLADDRGWSVARDGSGMRRVVASPEPRQILELRAIELLVDAGVLVVCSGGGGVPVVLGAGGSVNGIEAVVDKDLSAALLATRLGADMLLIATDVEGVMIGWESGEPRLLRRAGPRGLRELGLPSGTMGPKAEACARFVERTGARAAITGWEGLEEAIAGTAGTQVVPDRVGG